MLLPSQDQWFRCKKSGFFTKTSQFGKVIILIREKMTHKGENYSVKLQKYYFCNGTLKILFAGFKNEAILRSALRRLFRWLNTKGVTAIVTGERGDPPLTRYGLEECVADCVILFDNRMEEQIATRRLRIIKYRGSKHGTNEYPFLIEDICSTNYITRACA